MTLTKPCGEGSYSFKRTQGPSGVRQQLSGIHGQGVGSSPRWCWWGLFTLGVKEINAGGEVGVYPEEAALTHRVEFCRM